LFSDGNGVGFLGVKVGCFKVGLFGLGRTPLLQNGLTLEIGKVQFSICYYSQHATTNSIPHNNNLPNFFLCRKNCVLKQS
jgi:hypothetical protein